MQLALRYPVKEPIISQTFGANPEMYANPKYGGIAGHNGIDFMAQHGYPVYASHDGLASFQIDSGGGHGIVIVTDKEYESRDGQTSFFKTIYWHLCDGLKEPKFASPFQGKTGLTPVKEGDLIGYADNTGASTGDHLHFGLKACAKGENWGTWYNTNQNNGYNGAIDPYPYLISEQDIKIMEKKLTILQRLVELWQKLRSS